MTGHELTEAEVYALSEAEYTAIIAREQADAEAWVRDRRRKAGAWALTADDIAADREAQKRRSEGTSEK